MSCQQAARAAWKSAIDLDLMSSPITMPNTPGVSLVHTQLRSWEPPLALLGHELVGKLLARLSAEGEAAWVSALATELAAGAGLLRSSPAALSTLAGCLALPALPEAEAANLVQVHLLP